MINKINNVKDFGIFEHIPTSPAYEDFNKFNLFYGLNGSGKSTLSHLFSILELPSIEKRFSNSKWNFLLNDGTTINESKKEVGLNIKVFDKGFIERNISWNDAIKGILVVSETKKEEIKKRDQKKNDLKTTEGELKTLSTDLNGDDQKKGKKGIIKENSSFLTDAAKSIKEKFQLIEVRDTYLSNYNKTKLETALNKNKTEIQKKPLNTTEIEKLAESIKPQDKTSVDSLDISGMQQLVAAYDRIKDIIESTVTSIVLADLKDSPAKSEWAKQGLDLHKENDKCSFCGNTLTKERVEELNNHFSDSFKLLMEKLEKAIDWIDNYQFPTLPQINSLYKEYQPELKKYIDEIEKEIDAAKLIMAKWKSRLEDKRKDPFSKDEEVIPVIENENLNKHFQAVNKIISSHNAKFKNLDASINEAKTKLEIEYIKAEIKRYDYYKLKKEEDDKQNSFEQKTQEKNTIKKEIDELNKEISTEALGAEIFNKDLWKFLGRKDIELVPQSQGGYKIERNKDPNTKGQLMSEGEKTAIAFVYFINKLKEQNNKIDNTIVVVDDPVSSFDSNNLFSSFSYLKLNCNTAKQLFVLTHNFNYFRLVRDWFNTKNRKQFEKYKKDNSKPKSICNIYTLETSLNVNKERVSEIVNANKTLLDYSSEYHYQFNKLIEYSNAPKIDLDMAYLAANAARKTTETFLKFKYPKKLNDFKVLFEKAIRKTSLSDKEEYLYRFINKYSHAQDFDNDASDNQLDEGINVAVDILKMIQEIDKTHYEEMIEVCSPN